MLDVILETNFLSLDLSQNRQQVRLSEEFPNFLLLLYFTLCFEFEIPNKKKEKNLNVTNEDDMEIEPELEKVQEPVSVSVK